MLMSVNDVYIVREDPVCTVDVFAEIEGMQSNHDSRDVLLRQGLRLSDGE